MTIICHSEHESLKIFVKLTEYTNMTIVGLSEHETLKYLSNSLNALI